MKRIESIIRTSNIGKVVTALENAGHPGLKFSLIESRGSREDEKYQLRGRTYKADLVTKARLEVVVSDEELATVVDVIRNAALTGKQGDGEIYVHSMEDVINIRTGVRGEAAA